METHPIADSLSPLDGRYEHETRPLRAFFSEHAFLRTRVQVEIDYLLALAQRLTQIRPLTETEKQILRNIATDFDDGAVREIKEIEATTRHDVKAIEYFMRRHLEATSLSDVLQWLHFGLTSEDVNLVSQAIALRDSRDRVMLPALDHLLSILRTLTAKYAAMPMLARTHGQPAVPTTLGKELAVFYVRLKKQRACLADHVFESKLGGAVGNLNAMSAAIPELDWIEFSGEFIRAYGLQPNVVTTQLVPFDNWVRYFDSLHLTNSILIDLAQDMWRYISDDYMRSRALPGQIGSSTMPQKVNPIDFENAEGNLGIANALSDFYASKLPVSRLQRDLSDSTVRRTFGVALGHTLVALVNLARGLDKIEANEERMRADLSAHWEVVAEGAQTILRVAGLPDAYEQLLALSRGKRLTSSDYDSWVSGLPVSDETRDRLRSLTPFSYIGLAEKIAKLAIE